MLNVIHLRAIHRSAPQLEFLSLSTYDNILILHPRQLSGHASKALDGSHWRKTDIIGSAELRSPNDPSAHLCYVGRANPEQKRASYPTVRRRRNFSKFVHIVDGEALEVDGRGRRRGARRQTRSLKVLRRCRSTSGKSHAASRSGSAAERSMAHRKRIGKGAKYILFPNTRDRSERREGNVLRLGTNFILFWLIIGLVSSFSDIIVDDLPLFL